MATIISFCSAKGGSGKTAVSAAIASFLSDAGLKVLVIDADPATSGMTLLFLKKVVESSKKTQENGLFDELSPYPIMISDNLYFIPSSSSKKIKPHDDLGILSSRLQSLLPNLSNQYDVIILDTEAGTEITTRACIEVSDKAVIVTEFDPLSASGVERLKFNFDDSWPKNETYVIVNKLLPEYANIQSDYFTAWNHLPPIPFDFEVMRAYAHGTIPWNPRESGQFSKSIVKMTRELLPSLKNKIDSWFNTMDLEFKKPEIQQLKNIQDEIDNAIETIARLRVEKENQASISVGRSEKLFIYSFLGVGIGLFAAAMALVVSLPTSKVGPNILFVGFGVVAADMGWIALRRWQQRKVTMLDREKLALTLQQMEANLDLLFSKKAQIESLLPSPDLDLLERQKKQSSNKYL